MIITITGKKGTGKSTAAAYTKEALARQGIKSAEVSFADEIKRICMSTFKFSEEQLWGPSAEREKPDRRYPREHVYDAYVEADTTCKICGAEYYPNRPSTCYLTPRYALQTLGTEWGRRCYAEIWARNTVDIVLALLQPPQMRQLNLFDSNGVVGYDRARGLVELPPTEAVRAVIIPDLRFLNEWKILREAGVGHKLPLWRVVRKVEVAPGTTHQSEVEMDNLSPDVLIKNNGGLPDLKAQVGRLVGAAL